VPKKPEAQIGPELIVAQRIRQERQAREWSLDVLSRRLKSETGTAVTPSALSLVENGKRRITLNEALAYAKVFGIELSDLLQQQPGDLRLQSALLAANTELAAGLRSMFRLHQAMTVVHAAVTNGGDPEAVAEDAPEIAAILADLQKAGDAWMRIQGAFHGLVEVRAPALKDRIRDEYLAVGRPE